MCRRDSVDQRSGRFPLAALIAAVAAVQSGVRFQGGAFCSCILLLHFQWREVP
jgi:hypothetical protein